MRMKNRMHADSFRALLIRVSGFLRATPASDDISTDTSRILRFPSGIDVDTSNQTPINACGIFRAALRTI